MKLAVRQGGPSILISAWVCRVCRGIFPERDRECCVGSRKRLEKKSISTNKRGANSASRNTNRVDGSRLVHIIKLKLPKGSKHAENTHRNTHGTERGQGCLKATYKRTDNCVLGLAFCGFRQEFRFQYLPNWDARRFVIFILPWEPVNTFSRLRIVLEAAES